MTTASIITLATPKRVTITPIKWRRRLKGILSPLGGDIITWRGNDPHAAFIANHGQVFSHPVKMRRGRPNYCHANAADLWAKEPEKYQLVSGYALSQGHWLAHSWVVDEKCLYETTVGRERYFGAVLPSLLGFRFWMEEVLHHRLSEANKLLADRPGMVHLLQLMASMTKDESVPLMTAYEKGKIPAYSPSNPKGSSSPRHACRPDARTSRSKKRISWMGSTDAIVKEPHRAVSEHGKPPFTFCNWHGGRPQPLPRTDKIVFTTYDLNGDSKVAALADWSKVCRIVGPLITPLEGLLKRCIVEAFRIPTSCNCWDLTRSESTRLLTMKTHSSENRMPRFPHRRRHNVGHRS